jgi:glycosyltransferase involved in cell wall biosynthesis
MKPSVSVVVPTMNRPELVRLAIKSIRDQEYDGVVEVIVVFDKVTPDMTLAVEDPMRPVRVIFNERGHGLAGARNSGYLASSADFVGNSDDDDEWLPGKLAAQIELFEKYPDAELCGTGVRLVYEGAPTDRVLSVETVEFPMLLRSRLQELHPTSFLFRRDILVNKIGLVSEELPSGQSEDYEMLLRVARRGAIINVPVVYVSALRHKGSYFNTRWAEKITAWKWLLTNYPEFETDPKGMARITGQIAFAHAALGERRESARWARKTMKLAPKEMRPYLALLVSAKLISPSALMSGLNKFGRGI